MDKMMRSNRWKLAASVSMLVLALNAAGCSKLPGLASGSTDAGSGNAVAAPPSGVGNTANGTTVRPQPTTTVAALPGIAQPVAAHRGSIDQTLDLVGKVAATDEVPLSFGEKLTVQSVSAKAGQQVDAGQTLVTADASDIQTALDAANARLDQDSNALAQAQAAADAQQRQAAQQAAAAQQAQADKIAAAQANLNAARANLQKVQTGPSPADVQAAQNAVTAAQIAQRKAEADQTKADSGPDKTAIRSAEQELANAQAAAARAQADFDKVQPAQSASAPSAPSAAVNITPAGVSTDLNNPPNNYGFMGIAVDPSHPNTVYVGTSYQGLWKTTNSGQTWAKVNTGTNGAVLDGGRLWTIAIDPTNTQVLYTVPGYGHGGVWKSSDGGVNWVALMPATSAVSQAVGGVPAPSNVVIDPTNHLHLIASSHFPWAGKYAAANGVGTFESNDGGNSWTVHDPVPNTGAEHEVGMIDSTTWIDSSTSGMRLTTDAGQTWNKVSDVHGEVQNMLVINGVVYVPADTGLMRSLDHGQSWQKVGPGGKAVTTDGISLFTQQSTSGSSSQPQPLFSASLSDATTWTQYSTQTMCVGAACDGAGWMSADATNHILYFTNWDAGVWKLQTVGGPAAPSLSVTSSSTPSAGNADFVAAQQRLQTAKDNADAARNKLEALRQSDPNANDAAQLAVDQSGLALQAAQTKLQQLQAGPPLADLRAAQDAVALAQTALSRAQAGPVVDSSSTDAGGTSFDLSGRQAAIDKDNADIAKLQARLAATQLVAPFAGTVVSVRVRVGDSADSTQPAVTLAQPGVPVVRATITAADKDKVSVGQTALVQYQGQPDPTTPLTGTVKSLTPNDAGTASTAVVALDWGGTPPKLNSIVNLGLVLQAKDDALLVPKKAVHTVNSRSFVEVVDGKTKHVVNVQLGIVGAKNAEIVGGGLSEGQLVAVSP